jgi:DNA-binding NtrC family response regulator
MPERGLIVEPDDATGRLLETLLRRVGFDVARLATIDEAIPFLDGNSVAAVLVDISVSSHRFDEMAARTRRQGAAVLVFTTGRVDREMLELFVTDHVWAVFPKPFDIDEVASSLQKGIAHASSGSPVSSRLHGFLERLTKE